jgi:hypothetical protein
MLQVRGDGTNPILRLDSGSGTQVLSVLDNGNVAMTFADTSGLFYGPYSSGGVYSGIWDNKIAVKNTTNFSLLSGNGETYLNANNGLFFSINGPSTPLMNLTTSGFAIGQSTIAASARLQVRGDGTNPIARFETSAGTETHIFRDSTQLQFGSQGNYISATANGTTSSTAGRGLLFVGQSGQGIHQFNFSSSNAETSGTIGCINLMGSYGVSSGNALYQPLRIAYTINNVGTPVTGTATGIFLNATETALNGMGHNLIDLQVGGVSQFRVSRIGDTTSNGTFVSLNSYTNFIGNRFQLSTGLASNRTLFVAVGEGIMRISDATENAFNRINLGGNTNAFPAIKRNGAGIDFRLADDSAFCGINAGEIGASVGFFAPNSTEVRGTYIRARASTFLNFSDGTQGILIDSASGTSASASAILQADSTTKGFLPPRMTTTQVNAIASPAEGLVVFNTTISHLCVYQGGAWVRINHSPM